MLETTISKIPLTEKRIFEEIYVSRGMGETYAAAVGV